MIFNMGGSNATAINYDNTKSGLAAGTVQLAIDELKNNIDVQTLIKQSVSLDGSTFSKNFLLVSVSEKNHVANQAAHFYQTADAGWTNAPSKLNNTIFMGYREVYHRSVSHVMVKLTEMYPKAGRLWYNFFNVSAWGGWNEISPNIESSLSNYVDKVLSTNFGGSGGIYWYNPSSKILGFNFLIAGNCPNGTALGTISSQVSLPSSNRACYFPVTYTDGTAGYAAIILSTTGALTLSLSDTTKVAAFIVCNSMMYLG